MQTIDLEQGSAPWRAWRRTKRMSSYAPAVMGVSPYMSQRAVVRFYQDGTEQFEMDAMRWGRTYEPQGRAAAAELVGEFLYPIVAWDGVYGASLDGISDDGETIAEVKCPYSGSASETWKCMAEYGNPGFHRWQIEQQLLVTGAKRCLFMVWTPEGQLHQWVEPDLAQRARLLEKWDEVWAKVMEGRPDVRVDQPWLDAVAEYQRCSTTHDAAALALGRAHDALTALAISEREVGGGVIVQKVPRKGNVDYAAVPQLKGVDLEQYRKPGTHYWKVTTGDK